MPPAMQRIMLARFRNLRIAFACERGSFLVEVMVGAIVLAITTTAVLSGLDGAQDTGRRNKDRSELSTLAQQDLERLRSIPITSLSNYDETRTVRVATVDYTVHSTTEWVRDASGVVSCTDDNTQAEYMKVSSTVTSPASLNNPVTETTLLTPAPGAFSDTLGTAAVLVTDRDGNPRPGMSVSLSGAGSYSNTTNALGCAVFGYIPSGDYVATINGVVTWASNPPATGNATVAAGRTALIRMEVEPPASLRASFRRPPGTPGTATTWNRLSVAHSKLPAGVSAWPSATASLIPPTSTSIDATDLFPHNDGYGVYAGSCAANNPASWLSSYFIPGRNGYIELDPSDNLKAVNVTMPTLTVDINKRALAPRFGIRIRQVDGPDCLEEMVVFYSAPTASTRTSFTFQLPFGRYRVCVDDGHLLTPKFKVSLPVSPSTTFVAPATTTDTVTADLAQHQLTPTATTLAPVHTDRVNLGSGTTGVGTNGSCPTGSPAVY